MNHPDRVHPDRLNQAYKQALNDLQAAKEKIKEQAEIIRSNRDLIWQQEQDIQDLQDVVRPYAERVEELENAFFKNPSETDKHKMVIRSSKNRDNEAGPSTRSSKKK